ncbi:MAG TPA: glycosyltransferase [Candidatus Obscuribacterales bacterium]
MVSSLHHPSIALISVHGDPSVDIGREEAGGQNVYVRQVGEALARLEWDVSMFTRQTHTDQPQVVEHLPNCRTVRLTAGPEDFVPRDDIFGYLPAFVQEFLQYQRSTGQVFPLIHTNYWLSSWVGMQLKQHQAVQQVHTYHSVGAVKYQSMDAVPAIATTRLEVEQRCLETAERVVATSPQERDHLRSLVSSYGRIDVIPCGTDIERFGHVSMATARQSLGIAADAKVVLYVGRFDPRKGIETVVRAVGQSHLRQDERLQLIIGGGSRPGHSDGRERDRIEGLVADLGLQGQTWFPGRISDEDLTLYYAAADVCVVPSHYEPFGLVAIEAMASNTPVVVSDVGGLQYTVVPGETGLLAPVRDAEAFAQAIDRILSQPDWRDQLGRAARNRVVDYFSWDGVAIQLDRLYRKLLLGADARHLNQVGA